VYYQKIAPVREHRITAICFCYFFSLILIPKLIRCTNFSNLFLE